MKKYWTVPFLTSLVYEFKKLANTCTRKYECEIFSMYINHVHHSIDNQQWNINVNILECNKSRLRNLKKLPSMMYNEEAKIIYHIFDITCRYFRFFAMSLFLHRGERMKSCFADSNPTVSRADRSLRCKQNNIVRSCSLVS